MLCTYRYLVASRIWVSMPVLPSTWDPIISSNRSQLDVTTEASEVLEPAVAQAQSCFGADTDGQHHAAERTRGASEKSKRETTQGHLHYTLRHANTPDANTDDSWTIMAKQMAAREPDPNRTSAISRGMGASLDNLLLAR